MTKDKSDVSDSERKNETPTERGGAMSEDRSKGPDFEQADGPFGQKKEGKAAAGEGTSGERER